MKKQEEETARSSSVVPPTPPQEAAALDPQQQEMIEKLVAMQKQCNKRSFLDRPKVTVSLHRRDDFYFYLRSNLTGNNSVIFPLFFPRKFNF